MVLIDGDGMIFNNELLRLGEEGGRKAATQVKANISRFLRTEKEGCPSEFKVVARVYANVRGLSETLVRAGILSSSLIFEEFVRGFTRGDALCDFIDVGAGKDRADLKINGQSLSFQLANLLGTYTNGSSQKISKYTSTTINVAKLYLAAVMIMDMPACLKSTWMSLRS
jgi:hypothetical protein